MKRMMIAATAIGLLACALAAAAQDTAPKIERRAWATKSGLFHLTHNGTVLAHDDVLDRLKIQELFARWGVAFDEGDMTVMGSLFTIDGRLDISDGIGAPYVSNTGRDHIVSSITDSLKAQKDQRRHNVTNIIIAAMTRTTATVSAYGTVTSCDGDMITFNAGVVYSAHLVKGADGVWRFAYLNAGMDKISVGHRSK